MRAVLAQPRGFCAGVVRAVEIVELALDVYEPPVYVFHEIVHNRYVVDKLRKRGAVFVDDLHEVPEGSVAIFSAHGVSNAVVALAKARKLEVIDATCPLVTKVHLQAQKYSKQGYSVIIVGHIGHEEVEGTMGSVDGPVYVVSTPEEVLTLEVPNPEKTAYVTQTTLSLDDTKEVISALSRRFPAIEGPGLDDICYATQNRQNAVRELAKQVNLILVVGAHNSSNSKRLREVGEQCGVPAYLVQDATELDKNWFDSIERIGVTAGASTPEVLVQAVVDRLREFGVTGVEQLDGVNEDVTFRLPKPLLSVKVERRSSNFAVR